MDTLTTFTSINGMDSRDIAQDTGKQHAHVCRDIQVMLAELQIDQSKFGSVYKAGNGEMRRCYILPKRECLILATGYSVVLRAKIIDRWAELESGSAAPLGSKAYHQIFMEGYKQGRSEARAETIETLERVRVFPIRVGRPPRTDVSRPAPTEKVGDDGTFLLPGMVEAVKGSILKFAGEQTTMTAIFEHVRIPRNRANEMGVAYLLKSNGYERFHQMSKGIRTWVYRMVELA